MTYDAVANLALHYTLYPVVLLLKALLTILLFITAPFIHLGYYVIYACWWPFRFLAKFETLYIFFGVAALVGILTGTSLHYTSDLMASVFDLDSRPDDKVRRSLTEYRAARRTREEKMAKSSEMRRVEMHQPIFESGLKRGYNEWLKQDIVQQSRKGLIPNTILEEEDSSDNGF